MDKLMVVMLVAAGTVCLLTNLLVLCIILKQRVGRITFRYQIIVGQCMAGVISSTVMFYPLKVLLILQQCDDNNAFNYMQYGYLPSKMIVP